MNKIGITKYRYIERDNMGVIQKWNTAGWFDRIFCGVNMEWKDMALSYNKKHLKDLYEKSYVQYNKDWDNKSNPFH